MAELTRRVLLRHSVLKLLLTGAVFSGLSCGGGDSLATPTTGSLDIVTATSGPEPDVDGYVIIVDQGPESSIAASATIHQDELESGSHSVHLAGFAANCSVQGENPRTITVVVGESARIEFAVICAATSGAIEITTATGGVTPDADGYTVLVDGTERGTIGTSGRIMLDAVVPGTHGVGLSGIAANCRGVGEALRTVVVRAGSTTTVAFEVGCAAPPPATGTLRVSTTTGGPDADSDGYALAIDAAPNQRIGVNTTVTLANLSAGVHTVQLTGNEANCTIAGANPRTVTVPDGGTVEMGFTITCTARPPTTGALQVSAKTTGVSPDADGYSVSADGGAGQPIGVNESITIEDLTAGSHNVGLSGVSANCQVEGGNPRSVAVVAGKTTTVAFNISCTELPASTGTLRVNVATSGPDQDADGYNLAIDDQPSQAIAVNGTISIAGLGAGVHTVQLSGVVSNCTLAGTNPRSIAVTAGGTADASFSLTCVPTTGTIKVTVTSTGAIVDPDGYTVWLYSDYGDGNRVAVGTNASHNFESVPAGGHYVILGGLDPKCHIGGYYYEEGYYYSYVFVEAGAVADVDFNVLCTEQISIVLTWGDDPHDLQSHLTGPTPDGNGFHIPYYDGGNLGASPFAEVQYSWGGPETTVITQLTEGTYRFMVHDYENDPDYGYGGGNTAALGASQAKVEVYTSQGLVQTFLVPNEPGTLWTVFEITGGDVTNPTIVPVNTLSNESPYADVSASQVAAAALKGRAIRPHGK